MKKIPIHDLGDLVELVNHNTDALGEHIQKVEKKLRICSVRTNILAVCCLGFGFYSQVLFNQIKTVEENVHELVKINKDFDERISHLEAST